MVNHNLDVIGPIVDMAPEGGVNGGKIMILVSTVRPGKFIRRLVN